jgi:hypothetical protein
MLTSPYVSHSVSEKFNRKWKRNIFLLLQKLDKEIVKSESSSLFVSTVVANCHGWKINLESKTGIAGIRSIKQLWSISPTFY